MPKSYIFGAAGAVFLLAAIILYLCESGSAASQKEDTLSRPVKVVTLTRQSLHLTREFPGRVRASKRVGLSFQISGVLTDLPVREGMKVAKDDLLARLDRRDHENNLLAAQATFDEAKLAYERAQKLLKEGIVPQASFDRSKAAYDTALASLGIRKKALEDTEMRAPFDGIIARRNVENHEHINAHAEILSLQNTSDIEVVIDVPEAVMAKYGKDIINREFEVVFDALPDETFHIKVNEFSVDADEKTQTYKIVLTMPAPENYIILPGMTASVRTRISAEAGGEVEERLFLPAGALLGDAQSQESFVFVFDPQSKQLKRVRVTVGTPGDKGVPVLSGLEEGQQVVIAGSAFLREGMPVRPMVQP